MKIAKRLSLLLSMILLLQLLVMPAEATQADTEMPAQGVAADISVTQGCRTADGQVPLCGSTKMLSTAGSAMLFETTSGTLMYAWNPDAPMAPSSLTKIMTALLAVENSQPEEMVTVTPNALAALPENTSITDLQVGEQLPMTDLLYCLMAASSNDAALVIADHIAGSWQGFVSMMNQRAAELGCTGTVFLNPHGLLEDGQVTTARDMTKILACASENEAFMQYFAATDHRIKATNMTEERKLASTNYMMMTYKPAYYDPRVTGCRTGNTADRKRSIAVTAEKGDLKFVSVILDAVPTYAEDNFTIKRFGIYEETAELLDLGFKGYHVRQILNSDQILGQQPVRNGDNQVSLHPNQDVRSVIPYDTSVNELTYRYGTDIALICAPIETGAVLTDVSVWYGNVCIAFSPLLASNRVLEFVPDPMDNREGEGVSGAQSVLTWVLIIAAVVIALFICGILMLRLTGDLNSRRKHKKRQAERRRSR